MTVECFVQYNWCDTKQKRNFVFINEVYQILSINEFWHISSSDTISPFIKCFWMIVSILSLEQEWYQVPSGYTTAIGPFLHICRQLALVRRTEACGPTNCSSFSLCFKYFQDSRLSSFPQHLDFVWSQHRNIWRLAVGIPIVCEIIPTDEVAVVFEYKRQYVQLFRGKYEKHESDMRYLNAAC